MTWRTTAMLLAAITFMAALILISKRTGHTGDEPAGTSRRVMSFDARDARELIIETPTSRFTFENKGTSWQITHPVNAPANPAPVLRILETVAELKWSARLDPRELRNGALDEKETGFDRPRARIQIATAAGRTNVLTFGNQAGSSRQSYVRTHLRDEIMVADHAVLDLIPDSVMAFRERKLLPFSPDAITRLECITLTNTFQMSRDRDNNWKLDRPVQARADGTAVREWLNAFYTFQILSFVSDSQAAASLYGIDRPIAQLTFSSEGQTPHTIRIGQAADIDQQTFYAAIAGQDQIFTLDRNVLHWTSAPVDQFRDRSILPFSPDAIFSIAIRNGDQFVQLAKTSGAWVVESPQPVAAYQPAVDQLLHAFAGSPIMEFTGTTLPAETHSAGRTNAISFRALNSLGDSELFTLQLVGRSGEDRILCSVDGATGRIMIPGMLARFFSGSALRFRDPLVFQIDPNDIQRITQQLAGRSITLVNRDGLFHAEAPGLVPDTDALARIIGACTRLNANQLIADDARDVTLFGFEPGCRQLIFGMASEGINRVLLIGRTASDGHVYAMRQGHDLVFTLAPDLVDLLMTPVAHSVTVPPVMPSSKEL